MINAEQNSLKLPEKLNINCGEYINKSFNLYLLRLNKELPHRTKPFQIRFYQLWFLLWPAQAELLKVDFFIVWKISKSYFKLLYYSPQRPDWAKESGYKTLTSQIVRIANFSIKKDHSISSSFLMNQSKYFFFTLRFESTLSKQVLSNILCLHQTQ
jgi:hypothetical protein